MSSMIDQPMMAAPPPPVMAIPARTYNFTVVCRSGTPKEFSCQAADFAEARRLLAIFKEQN